MILINPLLFFLKTLALYYIFMCCSRHCEELIIRPDPWDNVKNSEKKEAVGEHRLSYPSVKYVFYCDARTWSRIHDPGFLVQATWTNTEGSQLRYENLSATLNIFHLFYINRLASLEAGIKMKGSLHTAEKQTLILIWPEICCSPVIGEGRMPLKQSKHL